MNNSSKTRIKEVEISLLQVLTYHANSGSVSHTKVEINEVIDSLDIGSVEAMDEKSFEHLLTVPEVPTTIVDGEAVDIKYKLKVEVGYKISKTFFLYFEALNYIHQIIKLN